MLQSIATARVESVSEVANPLVPMGNRGDAAFSVLVDKQQLATEAAAPVNASSEKAPVRGSTIETGESADLAASVQAGSGPVQEGPATQSQNVTAPQSGESKGASGSGLNTGVDFLQHLQASMAIHTELTLPVQAVEEAVVLTPLAMAATAEGKPEEWRHGEKSDGKLLPPEAALPVDIPMIVPVDMLLIVPVDRPQLATVNTTHSPDGAESLEIAVGYETKQLAGNSFSFSASGSKPGADELALFSAVAAIAEGDTSTWEHAELLGQEGGHAGEIRQQSDSQLIVTDRDVGLETQYKVTQGEGDSPLLVSCDTAIPATSASASLGTSATGSPATSASASLGSSATGSPATSASASLGTSATGCPATSASASLGTSATGSPATSASASLGSSATGTPATNISITNSYDATASSSEQSAPQKSGSDKGLEDTSQLPARSETKPAEPRPQLSDAQSRVEFRHTLAGADNGVAAPVLADDATFMVNTQENTGEQPTTQVHQGKAPLAKEMMLKEVVSDALSASEPPLWPQEDALPLVSETLNPSLTSGGAGLSGGDEHISPSAVQGDNLLGEAKPLSTSARTPQLSSVPQPSSERGAELYRELAAVNVSTQSRATPELAERLTLMIGQHWQEAELELEPKGMGKMTIQLSIGQDQQASVQFIVQQHHSREVVEQSLPKLKEMLAQQGIQLEQASVQQQTSGQGQNGSSGQWGARAEGEGSHGRGGARGQGNTAQSGASESAGQNLSVRSRQTTGIDFYA